jgi:hypothetical protein
MLYGTPGASERMQMPLMKLSAGSGGALALIGQSIQRGNRELSFRDFYRLVARIAKEQKEPNWFCGKHEMLSAGPKVARLGLANIQTTVTWTAHVGSARADRSDPRDCIVMLIANLVAEKHL